MKKQLLGKRASLEEEVKVMHPIDLNRPRKNMGASYQAKLKEQSSYSDYSSSYTYSIEEREPIDISSSESKISAADFEMLNSDRFFERARATKAPVPMSKLFIE